MAAEFRCHRYEDVVFRMNKKSNIEFGEVVGISEPLESADDYRSDVEYKNRIKEGFVRILWYRTGEKEVVEENIVGLADRYLLSGEVVGRPTEDGRESQLGKCISVSVAACVRVAGTKLVIFNVPREDLLPLGEFEKRSRVCLDSWIGEVTKVNDSLTLRTSDGSRCAMSYRDCARAFPDNVQFYPGQTFCGLLRKLEPALWLHRTDQLERGAAAEKSDTVDVTVESIETESVDVTWEWPFSPDIRGPPEATLSGEDLKRLEVLDAVRPEKLKLGDVKYYTLKEGDYVTTKGRWRRALREAALAGGGRLGSAPLETAKTRTDIDSDSDTSDDSGPDETASTESLTGDEAVLNRFRAYLENRKKESSAAPADKMTTTKYLSTALPKLRALRGDAGGDGSPSSETKELVRVATLLSKCATETRKLRAARTRGRARREVPAPAPTPGARVVVEVLHAATRADVVWQDGSAERGVPTAELVDRELEPHEDRQFFPGDVVRETVRGACGVVQRADRVGRTAVVRWFRAGELRTDVAEASFYEIEPDPDSHHPPASIVVGAADAEGAKRSAGRVLENLPEGRARVRWADGTVSACWPQHLRGRPFLPGSQEDDGMSVSQERVDTAFLPDIEDGSRSPDDDSAAVETAEDGGTFSMASTTPDDHSFKPNTFHPTDPKLFFKTVRKEIEILRTSLPGGVWVRGFEDRLDLFSAMVRGPRNTPYEDGLFLFDLQLSKDYPRSPPACRYLSRGRGRLNPNLYEDGTVCVSLLGTWEGRHTETWTAGSSLLQVIVSVQGLILVSEPYFNEPGAEAQRGSRRGGERSRAYNEAAVLGAVRSAVELVRRPPSTFRVEIARHFAENARKLRARLEGWLDVSERYNVTSDTSYQPPTASSGSETLPLQDHPLQDLPLQDLPLQDSPLQDLPLQDLPLQDLGGHDLPEFPLIPASKGFCITLRKTLRAFSEALVSAGIAPK